MIRVCRCMKMFVLQSILEVTLLLDDAFGDGLNGAQWGGIDGNVVIAACGEPLWVLEEPDFGYGIDVVVEVAECQVASGCTDPLFVEYDPAAVEDDGSCLTEVIYGCTDTLALNYNADANALETEDACDFTLTLLDGVGDGWFGSWLGVIRGDEIFGPYEMGPDDGVEVSFSIPLYSGEQVEVLFFTSGNAETTSAQCGFFIEGPQGIVVEGGTNPWNDAIKKFPYRYNGTPLCDDFTSKRYLGVLTPKPVILIRRPMWRMIAFFRLSSTTVLTSASLIAIMTASVMSWRLPAVWTRLHLTTTSWLLIQESVCPTYSDVPTPLSLITTRLRIQTTVLVSPS